VSEDFEATLRATTKIRKLLGLAAGNPNQHEAEVALNRARALGKKHMIDITRLQPIAPELSDKEKRARGFGLAEAMAAGIRRNFPPPIDDDD